MNNISIFCMALIFVYEKCWTKYRSWSEDVQKLDFENQFKLWLHGLTVLCMCGEDEFYGRGYWQKEFDKLEPSEVAFLSDIRTKPVISNLSLEGEKFVYKTLKKFVGK